MSRSQFDAKFVSALLLTSSLGACTPLTGRVAEDASIDSSTGPTVDASQRIDTTQTTDAQQQTDTDAAEIGIDQVSLCQTDAGTPCLATSPPGSCGANQRCEWFGAEYRCANINPTPRPEGSQCNCRSQCDEGLICYAGRCRNRCSSGNCASGRVCLRGADLTNAGLPEGVCYVCNPLDTSCFLYDGSGLGTCEPGAARTWSCIARRDSSISSGVVEGDTCDNDDNAPCRRGLWCIPLRTGARICAKPCLLAGPAEQCRAPRTCQPTEYSWDPQYGACQ